MHVIGLEVGDVAADFTLGFSLLWRGKPAEAETYLERGREVARAAGMALIETRCLVYWLVAKRRLNDVEGARVRLGELEELDELHGYAGLLSANAAWIAYRDGDLDRVVHTGEAALADWRSEGRTDRERLSVDGALPAPRRGSRSRPARRCARARQRDARSVAAALARRDRHLPSRLPPTRAIWSSSRTRSSWPDPAATHSGR